MLTLLLFYTITFDPNFSGVIYGSLNGTTTAYTVSSPVCGDGIPDGIDHKDQPIIQDVASDAIDCSMLMDRVQLLGDAHQYNKEYDTSRYYIEHCFSEPHSFQAFSNTEDGAYGLNSKGIIIWASYRDWLKKVLYYNPDTNYYCNDLLYYAESFEFKDEQGNNPDYKTTLAILKYVTDSTPCRMLKGIIKYDLNLYYRNWKDTVTDSLRTPFDTNYASIDSLGQGFLHGLPSSVDVTKPNSSSSLGEITAEKNPFTSEAVIHYVTNLPTVAKLEVYDALGKMLWTNGQGYLEPGNHTASIDGSQWSSGTYYVRLVTLKGEIKTCKLLRSR